MSIRCNYCGKEKSEHTFVIGACRSDQPDWTIWEGTGKYSCPGCMDAGRKESQAAVKLVSKFVLE